MLFAFKIWKLIRELLKVCISKNSLKQKRIRLNDEKYISRMNKRFIIYDIDIDITIIGIIPEDNIKKKFFLLPNLNNINYTNKNIYIPQFPHGKNLSYSEGKITNVNDSMLIYDAITNKGSSGSPIFLKETTEVIGIHRKWI